MLENFIRFYELTKRADYDQFLDSLTDIVHGPRTLNDVSLSWPNSAWHYDHGLGEKAYTKRRIWYTDQNALTRSYCCDSTTKFKAFMLFNSPFDSTEWYCPQRLTNLVLGIYIVPIILIRFEVFCLTYELGLFQFLLDRVKWPGLTKSGHQWTRYQCTELVRRRN